MFNEQVLQVREGHVQAHLDKVVCNTAHKTEIAHSFSVSGVLILQLGIHGVHFGENAYFSVCRLPGNMWPC